MITADDLTASSIDYGDDDDDEEEDDDEEGGKSAKRSPSTMTMRMTTRRTFVIKLILF